MTEEAAFAAGRLRGLEEAVRRGNIGEVVHGS